MSRSAEQQDLRDAVRGLLASAGAPEAAWTRLCREVGVAGLAIPERYGGAGAGPPETGVVKEELGREWLEPELFRIGASSLLADIERQLEHHVSGRYSAFNRHPVA